VSLRTRKLLVFCVALGALLAVFALYTRPEMMATLADQIWSCFQ
jgi:hypothetical protein